VLTLYNDLPVPSLDTTATQTVPTRVPRPVPTWLWVVLLAVITLVGALLRFHAIGQKNIWIDEGVSIALARLDWYNFLRILWRHEANMTLYYLFLRAWLPFGSSEAYIRTLSALFGLATIPAVFVLGRRMFDARVGFIASFLLAVNAYAVRYSQEARSYSLYPLLCVLSAIYFLKLLEEPTRLNRIAYVLTCVLAVYAHFFAGLLVVAQWLSFRLLKLEEEQVSRDLKLSRNDNEKKRGIIGTTTIMPSQSLKNENSDSSTPEHADQATISEIPIQTETKKAWRQFAIAVAPLAVFIVSTGVGVLRWVPRPSFSDLRTCIMFLTGNGGTILLLLYLAAICSGTVLALKAGWHRPFPRETWRYIFLLLWFIFPIFFVFLLSQLKPLFVIRYFVFTIPAIVLLAAAGLAQIRPRVLPAATLAMFGLLSLNGVASFYQKDFDIFREDWRSASRYILANAQPGDVILFHQPLTRMPYEYYRSVTPASNPPSVIYPQHGDRLMFRDFYAGRAPDAFIASLPAHYARIWVALSYNQLPSGPDPTTRFLTEVFGNKYQSMLVRSFPGIEVRLYSAAAGSDQNEGSHH
jgi:mannosyltransferase